MHAIDRERVRVIPDREVGRDPDPHLPVFGTGQPAVETAEPLVDGPANRDRGRHDALLRREMSQCIRQKPAAEASSGVMSRSGAVRVGVDAATEGGSQRRARCRSRAAARHRSRDGPDRRHEAGGRSRPRDLVRQRVEVCDVADVSRLPVESDAPAPDVPDDGLRPIVGGIVNDLDLHGSGPGSWARTLRSASPR